MRRLRMIAKISMLGMVMGIVLGSCIVVAAAHIENTSYKVVAFFLLLCLFSNFAARAARLLLT